MKTRSGLTLDRKWAWAILSAAVLGCATASTGTTLLDGGADSDDRASSSSGSSSRNAAGGSSGETGSSTGGTGYTGSSGTTSSPASSTSGVGSTSSSTGASSSTSGCSSISGGSSSGAVLSCSVLPSANGNGEFTCYSFGQGAGFKTFCGYQGSEASRNGSGSPCDNGSLANADTVPNVATDPSYFLAFPSAGAGWSYNGGQSIGAWCGMCVDVTYGGTTLTATVTDECPTCGDSTEHLDLSSALARDLGFGVNGSVGNPSGVTWKAVDCPVKTTNIQVAWNNSPNTKEAYFQNVRFPVKSVSGASQSQYSYWSPVLPGSTVTLTDALGHTVCAHIPSGNGDTGVQFPGSCN